MHQLSHTYVIFICISGDDKRVGGILKANERYASPEQPLHLFLCPVISFDGRRSCVKKPGKTCSSLPASQMQPEESRWKKAQCVAFTTLFIFPSAYSFGSSLCRNRADEEEPASQLDPGQSTGPRHPTGLKSPLHFFSLQQDSFCSF